MSATFALRLTLVLTACLALEDTVRAQQLPALPAPTSHAAKAPPLPVVKSPVDMFRELLALTPAAREQSLANRSPENRRRILEKVAQYEAMKPEDREERLRLTQLRWYLPQLLRMPAGEHAAQLAQVPEGDRPLIAARLQAWDELPADEQKAILKYEKTMEQFADQNLDAATATNNVNTQFPPQKRPDVLANLDNFLKLPPEERRQMYASFQRFFALTDSEKQKTLGSLSDTQRAQAADAVQTLTRLSPEERAQYLEAMNRFSKMTNAERKEFMKNAERWQQLTPAERQAWRSLVKHLVRQPPLPPGIVYPPLPPGISLQAKATNLAHAPQ